MIYNKKPRPTADLFFKKYLTLKKLSYSLNTVCGKLCKSSSEAKLWGIAKNTDEVADLIAIITASRFEYVPIAFRHCSEPILECIQNTFRMRSGAVLERFLC